MLCAFLDVIASPSTYPCQWVSQWGDSFRFGDSYRISELCELVFKDLMIHLLLKVFPIKNTISYLRKTADLISIIVADVLMLCWCSLHL